MIPVSLNLKNRHVLIIGGGRVALRKTKQYLKEGALITVVSPSFLEEFFKLDIKRIQDIYQNKYLENMFFVYACTNQKDINHQIVEECNRQNILCGSCTLENDASLHHMSYVENKTSMMAFSSYQKLPYHKPILNDMEMLLEKYNDQINLLSKLRPDVLSLHIDSGNLFSKLFEADKKVLNFLIESNELGYGIIFVYHKNRFKNYHTFNLEPAIYLSIEELKQHKELFVFPVRYYVVPLIIHGGVIYDRIKENINENMIDLNTLIHHEKDIEALMMMNKKDRENIWIVHNRQDDSLKDLFKDHKGIKVYDFLDDLDLKKDDKYCLSLILTGKGKHYRDLKKITEDLNSQGYDIVFNGNIFDHQCNCDYFEQRIYERIKEK